MLLVQVAIRMASRTLGKNQPFGQSTIRTLAQQGLSQEAIARHLGVWRTSVRRVLTQQEGR